MKLDSRLKKVIVSVIASIGVICFGVLIVSAIEAVDPKQLIHQQDIVATILAVGIFCGLITYESRPLTGIITGISISTFESIVNVNTTKPHYFASFILGLAGGVAYLWYPKSVVVLLILGSILATLWGHVDCAFIGLGAFIIIRFIVYSSEKLSSKLSSPIHLYINKSSFLLLLSFFIGYIVIIIFFALLYSSAHQWSKGDAFYCSLPTERKPNMNLGVFIYFSTITIATIGYGDIVPGNSFTRWVVAIESLAGMTWIVIYFSLLMKKLSENP